MAIDLCPVNGDILSNSQFFVTLIDYLQAHTTPNDADLDDIERSIYLHTANPHQSSDSYQGRFLQFIVSMLQPKVVVELGVYAAFSTSCMAQRLASDGVLYAVEADEERETLIREHLRMAGVGEKVQLCMGKALDVLPTLPDNIDLVFVDADKEHYPDYYERLLPKMRKGGVMLFDNMLWYGKVLDPVQSQLRADREAQIIANLNDTIQQDNRVENILLPIRDGIMMCRVK